MSDDAELHRPVDLDALADSARADPALFESRSAEPVFERRVLATPLHMSVASESRTNAWTEWNGYTVADVLTHIEDEYRALRHAAALTDISPLFKYRISGREAAPFLARFIAGNLSSLAVDGTLPVIFCEDRGFVVGDGLLFRLGDEEFRLVTEESVLAWLLDSAIGFAVQVEDVSPTLAALSLQGPLSAQVLSAAGFAGVETLAPGTARWFDVAAQPVYASRTGDADDLGFELWIDPEDASEIWSRLMAHGAPLGLAAAGFALRETARVEAGRPRAGRDYFGAFSAVEPDSTSTPFELGLGHLVDLERGHFTGRDALRAAKSQPQRHTFAMLAMDWPEPLNPVGIRSGVEMAGAVSSTAFSFSLGKNLALAMLKRQFLEKDAALHVEVEMRQGLGVRRVNIPARLVAGLKG